MKISQLFYKKILIVITILAILLFGINFYTKKKIENVIQQKFSEKGFEYSGEISVNVLFGNVSIDNIEISKDSLKLKSKEISINDFSYYSFLVNNKISIGKVKVNSSSIEGNLPKETSKPTSENDTLQHKKEEIFIKSIIVNKLNVSVVDAKSHPIKMANINLEITNFDLSENNHKKIPFSYDAVFLEINNFEKKTSEVQAIKFKKFEFKNNDILIDSLQIVPLKSRKNYIYHVPYEKELLDLVAKRIKISDFKIEEKPSLSFTANNIFVDSVFFNLYLNASFLEASKKFKPLYSKNLRDLPFLIDVKNLDIKNSKLIYEEQTKKNSKPGILVFDELNAQIKNINNNDSKTEKLTVANIQTKFMKSSPLKIKWTFDINNKNDDFRITGSLFNVNSKNMSSFILPAYNVKMDGYIHKMFFDFEGNNFVSSGKLNLDFKNFSIKILDDQKKKKKFLSWLANLFVKDTSKNGMVKTKVEELERDKTKSFWNYFWKNIEKGLQKSLI
ncbi:hypothetical protein JL193_15675 [Polaribacter batillariae]|uniref:DUF748 domain-containing protein n=1 Tax=Polaribacter batillariae TaxID=2808900 RepID=A0ABX7STK8_9FLAO|nr:hypothetical protein [Polaribacter batillariae]QTD37496.1 hypothetical protein JL193_15675 [Polaribacter batillariae]